MIAVKEAIEIVSNNKNLFSTRVLVTELLTHLQSENERLKSDCQQKARELINEFEIKREEALFLESASRRVAMPDQVVANTLSWVNDNLKQKFNIKD